MALRWSDPGRWGEVGRRHVRREALACQLLRGAALNVPELLASDLDGQATGGGSAILMAWCPGQPRLGPLGPAAVTALAYCAVAIHRQVVPEKDRPPGITFRGPAHPEVPSWTRRPEVWQRAISLLDAGAPTTPSRLLHGDFHFGNLLWDVDQISGVIDWAETSWGPADHDVAHLCSDFAMLHGPLSAETFRSAYQLAGGCLDPDEDARYWTVYDILGFLPDPARIFPALQPGRPDLSPSSLRQRLEDLLLIALAQKRRP